MFINRVLVLDLKQYGRKSSDQSLTLAHALFDLPYMAKIVEEMLLLRFKNEAWPADALDFVSCCLSGSVQSLMRVSNVLRVPTFLLLTI